MKSMLVAVMAVIVGLSAGCAQIEYLQNPENYRVNPLSGQRMYCHGDERDNYTPCQGWQSREQIAQKAEEAKIAEANARIAAENQAIADAKQAAIDKIAKDKASKLKAIADKKQAIAEAKADAKAEAEEKRQAAVDAKEREAFQKEATAKWNAMTPEQRAASNAAWQKLLALEAAGNARYNAEFQQRSRESSARERARQERNVFCHRNFGRSC